MKKTSIISNFTHKDIVNILAASVSGSSFIAFDYDKDTWDKLPDDKKTSTNADDLCFEDFLADLLLAGKSIELNDLNYEGEDMSDIRKGQEVNGEESGIVYSITLKDFEDAANTEEGMELMEEFMNGSDDFYTSENFLQIVMFGSLIYG